MNDMTTMTDSLMDQCSVGKPQIMDRFVDIPGGQVFVRTWLPAVIQSEVPMLLLHDSLGSVAQWRNFPQQLSEHLQRPVIAYDRLGFGQSTSRQSLPSYDFITEEAEVVFPVLCQALKIDQCCLVGHSVGGAMAIAIASLHPRECKAVITLAAPVEIHDRLLEGIEEAKQFFAHTETFNKLRKWHGEKTRWVLDAWTETWLSDGFSSWTIYPYLPKITAPVLAMHGDSDEYGPASLSVRIAEGIKGKGQQATIRNCGHIPHAEQTADVLALIAEFLTKYKVS